MSRSGRLQLCLLALAVVVIGAFVVAWVRVTPVQAGTSDFSAFYVGGTLVRTGHVASLYDEASQAAVHATLVPGGAPGNLAFVYPPPAALLVAPLSALPFAAAYRVDQALELLLLAGAVAVAVRAAPWPAAVRRARVPLVTGAVAFAGTGTLALGLLGQWDGIGALGVAGAYALWRSDRRGAGGLVLALSAGFAKPHLALGLVALLLGWRDRRVLLGAAAGVAILALTSLALVGPSGLASLVHATAADGARWPMASMLGFSGLLSSWLGDGALTTALTVVLGVGAAAVCLVLGARLRRGAPLEPCLAAATGLSLLAAPHMLSHDLVLLAPAFVMVAAWAARSDAAPAWPGRTGRLVLGGWVALNLAATLDLGAQAAAPPGRIVPVALVVVAGALTWSVLRRTPVAGRRPVERGLGRAGGYAAPG